MSVHTFAFFIFIFIFIKNNLYFYIFNLNFYIFLEWELRNTLHTYSPGPRARQRLNQARGGEADSGPKG